MPADVEVHKSRSSGPWDLSGEKATASGCTKDAVQACVIDMKMAWGYVPSRDGALRPTVWHWATWGACPAGAD